LVELWLLVFAKAKAGWKAQPRGPLVLIQKLFVPSQQMFGHMHRALNI